MHPQIEDMSKVPDLLAVVFTREPVPGGIKTRLLGPGGFDPETSAEIAWAMLDCTLRRLSDMGPLVLAVTPDGRGGPVLGHLGLTGIEAVDQGPGDLGERLERVWRTVAPDRPAAFFGIDSPDVPDGLLTTIGPALERAEAAVAATPDGGYWTIAGRHPLPALLAGIDWGSASVYHQTLLRAARAGIRIQSLAEWPDVDDPDVSALLGRSPSRLPPCRPRHPLRRLHDRLRTVCERNSTG